MQLISLGPRDAPKYASDSTALVNAAGGDRRDNREAARDRRKDGTEEKGRQKGETGRGAGGEQYKHTEARAKKRPRDGSEGMTEAGKEIEKRQTGETRP
ncbi:hypothetical protein EBH_0020240 [Eimeria brunetti]|uniref:Uncharacterized protein n=1 Tax=Eimeria brunetti TaxID=51314 RepID=U6L5H1_9EIME|nr:hypothetical protein EBH_0020240 [Eimeria brunetti]